VPQQEYTFDTLLNGGNGSSVKEEDESDSRRGVLKFERLATW
jgi:hypothetical protein